MSNPVKGSLSSMEGIVTNIEECLDSIKEIQNAPTHRPNLMILEEDDQKLKFVGGLSCTLRHVVWEPLQEELHQSKNLCHTRFKMIYVPWSLMGRVVLMSCHVHLLIK